MGMRNRRRLFRRRCQGAACARGDFRGGAGRQRLGRHLPAHRQADRRCAGHAARTRCIRATASSARTPTSRRRCSTPGWSGSGRRRRRSARWATSPRPGSSRWTRGVPCLPGYQGEDQSDARFAAEAQRIGLPLMVKAAAGGGGRGMRLVTELSQLPAALASARSEAQAAFGSGELLLERALLAPRHVEVQVFADTHGHCIHLGERDCSVQRRHQKIIEETPSPAVDAALARTHGPLRGGAGAGGGLRGRGHGGVPAGRESARHAPRTKEREMSLLHDGDEHAAAGRASGHRGRDRPGPGGMAIADRAGRTAAADAARRCGSRAMRSRCGCARRTSISRRAPAPCCISANLLSPSAGRGQGRGRSLRPRDLRGPGGRALTTIRCSAS